MADPRVSQLDPEDRKTIFRDYVQELEDKEVAARNAEREARRVLERAKKDELKAVLNSMVEKAEVHRRKPCKVSVQLGPNPSCHLVGEHTDPPALALPRPRGDADGPGGVACRR